MAKEYELLPHTADLAFRVRGATMRELFARAAFALEDIIAGCESIEKRLEESVRVEGADAEELLVNWLDELLYRYEVHGKLYSGFEIEELADTTLAARVFGETFDDGRHQVVHAVKAVTFHDLAIRRVPDGWEVTVVLDV